jgi:hypothetical protein
MWRVRLGIQMIPFIIVVLIILAVLRFLGVI